MVDASGFDGGWKFGLSIVGDDGRFGGAVRLVRRPTRESMEMQKELGLA
jgi:hypothetical protein